jgi:predicted aminopeptidase
VAQAACGHLDVSLRARPLAAAASDPSLPPAHRALLAAVPEIQRFGEAHGLRATGNYQQFVPLPRRAVVYSVVASDPLRFQAKTWWFPIVGEVPYLGFFDREDARAFADTLAADGYDADLYGADAYSTLGVFRDPVLSSMLRDGPEGPGVLADVVLHETVHATLFLDGQPTFNESLAEFVAERLTGRYLDQRFGPDSAERRAFAEEVRRDDARRREMNAAHEELTRLYASARPVAEKLAEKQRIFADLRRRARFRRPVNNATLVNFKNYNTGGPELTALLAACGGSFTRFLQTLARFEKDRRAFTRPDRRDLGAIVAPLVRAGCPAG